MSKSLTQFRCQECGATSSKWAGRCSSCDQWNTIQEERVSRAVPRSALTPLAGAARPITELDVSSARAVPTGVDELDRVLGGGLVPGSVTLLGGEPGVGKSTLLLQVLASVARQGRRVLLVSGEESASQVHMRAERLGCLDPGLFLVAETSLPEVLAQLDELRPEVCVIDSVQTMSDPDLESSPGSVAQVRDCAHSLSQRVRLLGTALVLVGHVTKEGTLAGPRVLEHLVDTVLSFEGERHQMLRLVRAVKHRFGATGELGLFEMGDTGLRSVPDASAFFLADRRVGGPGSIVVPSLEGQRPLLVELQTLVVPTTLAMPRRTTQGVDGGRLALMLAVLDRRAGVKLGTFDVFASVAGGVRVTEPAADLPLALALVSASTDAPLPPGLVVFGEIGLAGEVRQVSGTERRLSEAARLGFVVAMVPGVPGAKPQQLGDLVVVPVSSLTEAIEVLTLRKLDERPA